MQPLVTTGDSRNGEIKPAIHRNENISQGCTPRNVTVITMRRTVAWSEGNCRRRKSPSSRSWTGRVRAVIESVGPAILHRGNNDRAAACGHYGRARRPVRVAIKDPGNRLKFPDNGPGVLIELDHAETVVGRRLRGFAGIRISSCDVKTFTSAGDGAPHTATPS